MRYGSYRPPAHEPDPWDGLLLVDKPSGPTSHDVVAIARRHLGLRKVGHGGTLDPNATGLLVLLLGRATRLSSQVMGGDKTYEGTMRFGIATDSQDADGQVTAERDPSGVTAALIEEEMRKRVGDQMQLPPMVSAIKKDGVPLYKLARKGQTVEREPRLIHVYEFRLHDFTPPDATFSVRCTKGTYVRTLCADIGEALGCGAHLLSLRRTQSGGLDVKDAIPLDQLRETKPDDLLPRVLPMREFRAETQPEA